MSSTTQRYKATSNSAVDSYNVTETDEYQFGCEFEFYIDIERYGFEETIDKIKNRIQTFTNADILMRAFRISCQPPIVLEIVS